MRDTLCALPFAQALAREFESQALRATKGDPEMANFAVTDIVVMESKPGVRFVCSEVPAGAQQLGEHIWSPDRPLLIELLKKTYEHRSRRLDTETGQMLPIPERWGDIVRDTYHPRFEHAYPGVGPGWCDLIVAVCVVLDERKLKCGFTQIKEKFGTLRLYNDGGRDVMEIESCAHWLSCLICEECGAPGRRRGDGWIKTLCDLHAEGHDA